jgi:sugar lactone lactonase YvrE
MTRHLDAEPVLGNKFDLAEGPTWTATFGLTWVDIFPGTILTARPTTEDLSVERRFVLNGPVSAALPRLTPEAGWLLAADTGFAHLTPDGRLTRLAQPEAGERGKVRMNDAKCDPLGRLWAGSMGYDEAPFRGSLFRVDLDGTVERVRDHLQQVSNGMGWSPDGTAFYYSDSGHGLVYRADYDLDRGLIGRLVPFIKPPRGIGVPDGLTVDREGNLWVAFWGAGAVHQYDSRGRLLTRVSVAASQTTSCCLGGGDGCTLFITTASHGLSTQQLIAEPDAGRLFAVTVDVPGEPTQRFAGELPRSRAPTRAPS